MVLRMEPRAVAADLEIVTGRLRRIAATVEIRGRGMGSGVIWRADGVIVTSAHVVGPARAGIDRELVVQADGMRLPATLAGWDGELDLALLRVGTGGLPAAVVADSDRLRPGQLVLAVGHPYGLAGALTTGVVHVAPTPGGRGRGWIQADLRLAPGNSGGPLADARGHVVGVNAMTAGGLALAVPSRAVQAFVARMAGR